MKKIYALICLLIIITSISVPAFSKTKIAENDYIKFEETTNTLNSRLSDKYTGYQYTIKNIYTEPVTIQNIAIRGNAPGQVAYLSVKKTGSSVASNTMNKGYSLALPTLCTSIIGAAVVTPFVVLSNRIGNTNAEKEAQRFDTLPKNPVTIKPNQSVVFKTMVMHKYKPTAGVIFVNPITDEFMTLDFN